MKNIERILSLKANVRICNNKLYVHVTKDENIEDKRYGCIITLPPDDRFSDEFAGLLAIGVLLGFAGLCSPKQIILPLLSYDQKKLSCLQRIFQIVSDARILAVYGHENLIHGKLELIDENINKLFIRSSEYVPRSNNHVLQLCSGGLDSFCSILKFLEQGKTVNLLHVSGINVTNTSNERKSTQKISKLLKLNLEVVDVEWLCLKEFGMLYNPEKYAIWPQYNAVPFGRDFLLLVLGGWFSRKNGAKIVGIANDFEGWRVETQPTFRQPNELAVRNELSSGLASDVTLEFLNNFIDSKLKLISPLISMTKYAVVDFLAKNHGNFIKELSSCFWGNWCGECNKCIIYGLLFAQYESIDVPFKVDPVEQYGLQQFSDDDIVEIIKIFNEVVPD